MGPLACGRPLVGLLERTKSRTRGSGADGGVRPTFGCDWPALWGRPSFLVACQPYPSATFSVTA